MFNTLAEITDYTTQGQRRAGRGGQPIRRHSRAAGRCEAVFWKRMSREDARKIVFAARRHETQTKKKGERNGALGHVAIEIIDLLANLMCKRTGRLDPSIEFLCRTLRRSRDAIVRGLQALRRAGFLDWLRRYEPTGRETGPQVKQATNAYRLVMPAMLGRLLGRFFTPAPTPDDEQARIDEIAALVADYMKQLDTREFVLLHIEDNELAQALIRLGVAIKQRESAKQGESLI